MQPSFSSARPAAALALVAGLALLAPGTALAGTTEPTGTTTGTTSTASPTPSASTPTATTSAATATSTAPSSPSATTSSSTPSSATSTAPGATTGPPNTTTTTTSTATPPAARSAGTTTKVAPLRQRPFGTSSSLRAALVPGGSADQAAYAGGFIVRTLKARGDHYTYPASTYFDGGNTIDAVLALDGAGVGLGQADATTDYLAAHVGDYVGYATPAGTASAETYAGPLGKLVVGVVAQGGDPTSFGGQNLLTRLQGLMTAEGRFSDKSAYGDSTNPSGDYSNTIGQALDVIALGRATGSVPQPAGDYLLAQQCADGGFRGNLDAAGTACTSDLDATAFAAQALIGLGEDAAASKALHFLAAKQASNGGFRNQDGQYNANTAGVAAQAFAAGGYSAQLARAQAFLAGLQLDCSFAPGLRGGIAFTAADAATLKTAPKTTAALDRVLRATPQAALGLAGDSLLTVTAEGAAASAPTLACATASTTTTTSGAPVGATSSSSTAAAAVPAAPASSTPSSLAFTGADVAAMSLLGLLLVLAGVAAIVLARRKGVHA